MDLRNSEKLILLMLSDIHQHFKINGEIDAKLIKAAIFSDNTWGLEYAMSGLFDSRESTPKEVKEVWNILEMWSRIESSYQQLSPENKAKVKEEAPFHAIEFNGFDGNNESEYMNIASFIIKDLQRYDEFSKRDINSHISSIDGYRKMLAVFEPIKSLYAEPFLSAEEISKVLGARAYRQSRED